MMGCMVYQQSKLINYGVHYLTFKANLLYFRALAYIGLFLIAAGTGGKNFF